MLTRLGQPDLSLLGAVAPGLLYQKWHPYDRTTGAFDSLGSAESRQPFLVDVAKAVHRLVGGADGRLYEGWYQRYFQALSEVGVEASALRRIAGATVWRLAAGFGVNPALESGLHLYPLYGFPYLPGSTVRGLVHHVAEMDLIERPERVAWSESVEPPDAAAVDSFLDDAEQVHALFGSLTVEPIPLDRWREAAGETPRRETPRSLLKRWLGHHALKAEDRQLQLRRAKALLAVQSGGLAAFYDAVPDPGTQDILQVDILNPHYPEYYRSSPPDLPPSDDQNPVPVYFLAVRPGVRFVFPFRLAPWPEKPKDTAGKERLAALGNLSREAAGDLLEQWLTRGVGEWGVGAKTAAGYGYFALDQHGHGAGAEVKGISAPSAPQTTAATSRQSSAATQPLPWSLRLKGIGWGNADARVPSILRDYEGNERMCAAKELVRLLGRKKLLNQKEKPWVSELLRAADPL